MGDDNEIKGYDRRTSELAVSLMPPAPRVKQDALHQYRVIGEIGNSIYIS